MYKKKYTSTLQGFRQCVDPDSLLPDTRQDLGNVLKDECGVDNSTLALDIHPHTICDSDQVRVSDKMLAPPADKTQDRIHRQMVGHGAVLNF